MEDNHTKILSLPNEEDSEEREYEYESEIESQSTIRSCSSVYSNLSTTENEDDQVNSMNDIDEISVKSELPRNNDDGGGDDVETLDDSSHSSQTNFWNLPSREKEDFNTSKVDVDDDDDDFHDDDDLNSDESSSIEDDESSCCDSSVNSNLSEAAKAIAAKLESDRLEDESIGTVEDDEDEDDKSHATKLLGSNDSDDDDDSDDNLVSSLSYSPPPMDVSTDNVVPEEEPDSESESEMESGRQWTPTSSSTLAHHNLSSKANSLAAKLENDRIEDMYMGCSKSNDDHTQITYESKLSCDSGSDTFHISPIREKEEQNSYDSEPESEMEAGYTSSPSSFNSRNNGGENLNTCNDKTSDMGEKKIFKKGRSASLSFLLCLVCAMIIVIISMCIATVLVARKPDENSSVAVSLTNNGGKVPSTMPSISPSDVPSLISSTHPTTIASTVPSNLPSLMPSTYPTTIPSTAPSNLPSLVPSTYPTTIPSTMPSNYPSMVPSIFPSDFPSTTPSMVPSVAPSTIPSSNPSAIPSAMPSTNPSLVPSRLATTSPSLSPSSPPSASPSTTPSITPTAYPTATVTIAPSKNPTTTPTEAPSMQPTTGPTWFSLFSANGGELPPIVEPKIKSGPMVGHTTHNSAKIWALQGEGKSIILAYQRYGDPNMRDLGMVNMPPRRENNMSALGEIHGLQASTRYTYQLYVDAERVADGEFTTAPTPGRPAKFHYVLTSCINVGNFKGYPNQPVWDHVYEKEPDFTMLAGDTIYLTGQDWNSQGVIYDRVWIRNMDQRDEKHFARFISHVPTFSAWDDHEYGSNNAERGQRGKENSLKAWKDLWANPSYGTPQIKGNFYSYYWGNVHFIVMDNRWYRDRGQQTQFGTQQKEWLYRQLEGSQGTFKVIVTGCDIMEAGYERDTDDIGRFITRNKIYGVIFNAGDIHRNEFKTQTKATWPYTVTQFSSSGIARDNWMRPWSIINVNTELSDPEITAHFYGADSREEYTTWSNEPNLKCSEIQGVDRYKESRCTETIRLSDLTPAGIQVSL